MMNGNRVVAIVAPRNQAPTRIESSKEITA